MPKKNLKDNSNSKRRRTDTFWMHTDSQNAEYFNTILRNRHDIYTIDRNADVNQDYNRKNRGCWVVVNKITGERSGQLRSTKSYRLAMLWAVSGLTRFFHRHPAKREHMLCNLPRIKTRKQDHTRHRCPNGWCCNPGHLQIGTREENEIDKHFHYFLKMTEEGVSRNFMDTFRDLCRRQRVFGLCK